MIRCLRTSLVATVAATSFALGATPAGAAVVDLGAPAYAGLPGGTIVFRDEFVGRHLNSSRWSTLRGSNQNYGTPYNPEIEAAAYATRNVSQRSGKAVLTLLRRPAAGYRNYPYSSGMIHSGHSFAFRYGYVEARILVPKCSGCWPAFWMLNEPVDSGWPPEIDIFEFFNSQRNDHPFFTYHYRSAGNHLAAGPAVYGNSATGEWHTYGLRWTPTSIQPFFDGVPGPGYGDVSKLPTRREYLIFNLGLYKHRRARSGSKMQIDWVRVWQ